MLNPVSAEFVEALRRALPAAAFRELTPAYLEERRGLYKGYGGVLLAPASAAEVAVILRAAMRARVGVVPYGGGTGLVGGQVKPDPPAPLILSLERMRKIRAVLPADHVLIAEAGVVLADVQAAAEAAGRLFPLQLASEGSARVGGLLSTNAGGVHVLRYGVARALCLGLEAVLPDGRIWHGLTRLAKDNTGYDLRDLLVGAEGTLGVITAASLRLWPRNAVEGAAMMAVASPAAALELLECAEQKLGGQISAFELIHRQGLEFLAEVGPEHRLPLSPVPEWMVLVDIGGPAGLEAVEALTGLYEAGHARGLVSDGVVAMGAAQRAAFWALREAIPEANRREGAIASNDISLPLAALPEFIERAGQAIARLGRFRINCFGHLGDGNLHYNVFPLRGEGRERHAAQRGEITRVVNDLLHELGGSFSAEHGIGRLKVSELERYGDPTKLAAMRALKAALDPLGIMNPGAVLREA